VSSSAPYELLAVFLSHVVCFGQFCLFIDVAVFVNSRTSRGNWSPVPPVRRAGAYQLGKLVGTPRSGSRYPPVSATGAVPPCLPPGMDLEIF